MNDLIKDTIDKNLRFDNMEQFDIDCLLEIENSQDVSISSRRLLEDSLKDTNKKYWVAKSDGLFVGYLGATILVDHIDLVSIVVSREYTRRKIATGLLNTLIDFAKSNEIDKIFLEVRVSNITAISFYEKHGFKYLNTRKNYYSDNLEDARIYLLEI